MITIQIDGKTYKPTENFWEWLKNGIRLKTGDLEEVKENKEPSYDEMIEMGMPTELVGMQWYMHDGNKSMAENNIERDRVLGSIQDDWKREHGFLPKENKEQSILSKLREHLDERKSRYTSSLTKRKNTEQDKLIIKLINEIDLTFLFLDSLEEEKETEEVNYLDARTDEERARDEAIQKTVVTTSTQQIREVIVPEYEYIDCVEVKKGKVIVSPDLKRDRQLKALTEAVIALQKHPLFNNQK